MSLPRRSFPTVRVVVLVAIVALLVPLVAAHGAIVVDPFMPHAGESFQVAVGGVWILANVGTSPSIEVDGSTIRMIQDVVVPNILPPTEVYAFTAEVPPLAAGQYTVQFFGRPVNASTPGLLLVEEKDFVIEPASTIQAFQTDPSRPASIFVEGENLVRFEAAVYAGCARLLSTEVFESERRVDVPVDRLCPILPPAPTLMHLETEAVLNLSAGSWTVRLMDGERLLTTTTVEALPSPVMLHDGRFAVDVEWFDQDLATTALPVSPPSRDSALYWFFHPANWELMLKVLDGCGINGHYWVFGAAQTDRGYRISIRDTMTDATWQVENLAGTPSPAITDINAFANCP